MGYIYLRIRFCSQEVSSVSEVTGPGACGCKTEHLNSDLPNRPGKYLEARSGRSFGLGDIPEEEAQL